MLPVSELLEAARGLDEQRSRSATPRYSAASRDRVPVVVWNVTGQCNMTCPHCYASAALAPTPGELSTERALALLEEMSGAHVSVVIFSGGEPLLRADLLQLIERATELGLHAQLSTNGVLIDAKMAHRLRSAGIHYVGVSIDGAPRFNDEYRGLEQGFERASAGLRNARSAGMRTGLRMTLTKRNQDQLLGLLQHAQGLGVDRFYVSHLLYAGRAIRLNRDDLSPAESRESLDQLFEQADDAVSDGRGTKIVTGGNDSDGPALFEWIRTRYGDSAAAIAGELLTLRGGNSAGDKILNIDHRGEVHPDQFWRSASFGNVTSAPFSEALAHPLRLQLLQREQRLTGRCGTCRYLAWCRGSHRERALSVGRDTWGPDPACVMTDQEVDPQAAAQPRTA